MHMVCTFLCFNMVWHQICPHLLWLIHWQWHRENSPRTQKISTHPWSRCQTQSNCAYQATQTPLMLPFDTQVCHEHQICLRFHWILKVIFRNGFFSTLHTDLKVKSNFYDHYQQSCKKKHLLLAPVRLMRDGAPKWGELCSRALKRGQRSLLGIFSLWGDEATQKNLGQEPWPYLCIIPGLYGIDTGPHSIQWLLG